MKKIGNETGTETVNSIKLKQLLEFQRVFNNAIETQIFDGKKKIFTRQNPRKQSIY